MEKREWYQRKLKYRHFVKTFSDGKRELLLGADVNASPDDIDIYVENLDFYDMYMQLSEGNQGLVGGVIDRLIEEEYHEGDYDARNFDIVTDFITQRYDKTITATTGIIFDYEEETEGYSEALRETDKESFRSSFYHARRENEAKDRKITNRIKAYCAYYMISWDILLSGKGIIYNMKEDVYSDEYAQKINEKYTYKEIERLISDDARISTKEIILKITGLREDELEETPARIFKSLSPEREKAVMILVEELLRRQ